MSIPKMITKSDLRIDFNKGERLKTHLYLRTEANESSEDEVKHIITNNFIKNHSQPPKKAAIQARELFELKKINHVNQRVILNESPSIQKKCKNVQIPYEYLTDIFQQLHTEEIENGATGYMDRQKDINERMRAVVVNWMIEVHFRFKLYPETLFLSVNILDRYLSRKLIKRNKLQLLGVVCLLIACKYEEIFSPEIRDFVCILDKSYEKDDILLMEKDVLKVLKFNVTIATSFKFFEILCVKTNLNKLESFIGRYLLELSLINHKFLDFHPSVIACSAFYMVLILYRKDSERKNLISFFYKNINYRQEEITECVLNLCFMLENADYEAYGAVKKKFSTKQMMEVAKIKLNIE
jgi:hypothetical protein